MYSLTDQVAFVTGGSTGIGAKIVEYLLEENVKHVTNVDVDEVKGVALQNELNKKYGANKVTFIKGDVTNDDVLSKVYDDILKEQGQIDVVINNAGILNDSLEKYKKSIEVNLTAVVTNTLKALKVMRKDEGGKGGVVLNVSSISALYQTHSFPIYNGTKSAVLQFSNCIGLPDYYNRTGVRVLTICFGGTDTGLLTTDKFGSFDEDVARRVREKLKYHKFQKAESAARAVIDSLKQGESGSTWLSIADRPAKDITEYIKKAYGILGELVLTDQVAFVTGGSSGIGAKVVEYLLEENVKHVTYVDVDEVKGVALQNELSKKYGANKVTFIKGDVTNDDILSKVYDTILKEQGQIDVVINNAGIVNDSLEKYKKSIEVNVTAVVTNTLKALKVMRRDEGGKGGVVLNVSSIEALYQQNTFPIYNATKSAVLQFSNCIGLPDYYNRTGVRVLTICFGATDTTLLSKDKFGSFDEEITRKVPEKLKYHKFQKVESAARAVIDSLKQGESGSTWLSIADRLAKDITEHVKKAYGILGELVFT
ncbi:alcohol dehydrogenase-related 31 kDa protein-like [Melitaea cinxia]|uniref:alcohol dehydrogenase-related 31 kDa protein-like n=1 Tax=Melitaea cinxia TaxID=113334 RepID=UPI001E26F9D9|nr:alcohol dehydrogenase-related 31 kDa protein-like [Melitaea cinxia]